MRTAPPNFSLTSADNLLPPSHQVTRWTTSPLGNRTMYGVDAIPVSTKPLARYMVPSPHCVASAKLTTHFRCGYCLRRSLNATARHLLSPLRGIQSAKAILFSSMNSFQSGPLTSPCSLRFSRDGPNCTTPPHLPSRNAPR